MVALEQSPTCCSLESKLYHFYYLMYRLEPECRSSTSPVKLIDFSLACFFFEPTEPGGTPEFMAPELVADPDGMAATGWGPEIDMWAVGILVFWMLCGRTPFDDDNVPQILQNIMQVQVTASQDDTATKFQQMLLLFSLTCIAVCS